MKVTMEFDITPQEARKLMGLPDIERMQEKIIGEAYDVMSDSMSNITDPEKLFKWFMPMGSQGIEQFQKIMGGLASMATGGGDKDSKKGDGE